MSQVFIRSEQLADKIHEIKLLMPEWKVLFALDGKMATDEIAAFLEISPNQVGEAVRRLQDLDLIAVSGGAAPDQPELTEDSEAELTAEEPELSFPDITETEESVPETTETEPPSEFIEEREESQQMTETAPGEVEQPREASQMDTEEKKDFDDIESQLSEETSEDEHLEEIKLEDETAEVEEETEEDLDSLINDLLKEEVTSEEGAEEPKILDESEMADLETNIELPEEESPDEEVQIPESESMKTAEESDTMTFETEVTEEATEELEQPEEIEKTEEKAAPDEEVAEEMETATPPAEGQKTILVVDDSIVIRKMVEIALENENYEVVSVANGKDAFSYLDAKNPNLVILDIMLPDVNGLDILKAIKASKKIPVVMLSAKDTPKETSQAKDLGADDFIPKPFRDEELVNKIHELIGQ